MDQPYIDIAEYKRAHLKEAAQDHFKLNQLHDEVFQKVLTIAMEQVSNRYGPPPSPFSFFVMGSAGRYEQSIWSDQDHGIIYQDDSNEAKSYFLILGKEMSKGLYRVGYPYCDGGVMASNPFWCKSLGEWRQQVTNWIQESSWESVRYLLIFLDSRSIYGESRFIEELKTHIYQSNHHEQLLTKSLNNTLHLKKGINLLGKLLVETHGPHAGALNIKEVGLFPFVNAIRLLSMKHELYESSTLARFEQLPDHWFPDSDKLLFQQQFFKLLTYRLLYSDHTNYDSGHYLAINRLTKDQTKEVKEIIKNGAALFHNVRRLVEKDDPYGDE